MGSKGRGVLFYGYIFLAVGILVRFIFIPLFHLVKIGKIISYKQAAEIIGRHFNEVKDKLINTLQLHEVAKNDQSDLIEASINQRINELKPVKFSAAIDFKENIKFLKWAAIPLVIFLLLWFFFPAILKDSSNRIVNYQVAYEAQAPFKFTILNSKLSTPSQQDFELLIEISGSELPQESFISIDNAKFRLNKADKTTFTYTFKNVQRDVDFKLYADGYFSEPFKLKALPNPVLTNFRILLDYPGYTGLKDELISNTGDLNIPSGTKATWEFSTQNTSSLKMSFSDTSFSVSETDRGSFRYDRKFKNDNTYKVSTSNNFIKNNEQVEYSIRVKQDAYPTIAVKEQADSMLISRLYFKGETGDDYGFTSLKFIVQKRNDEKVEQIVSQAIPFNSNDLRSMFFWAYDFSELELVPGEELEYWFEVRDNDGIQGPKASRTQKQFFKVPTVKEIAEQREKDNQEIKSSLKETIEDAKKLKEDIKKLNEKLLEKKEMGWEEKKKIQDLLKQQQELNSQVEKIKQENKENNSKNEEFKKSKENILEKQEQLEKLLDELLSEEMKEKLKELEKLLEKMDKKSMKEKLDEMQMDTKDLEKELDRSLELFKQLEFEEKLNETIEKLDELQEKQEKLSEKSENKKEDADKLKEEQDELSKDFEDIRKDIDDLEKKNEDLENSQEMENTDKMEEDIQSDMQESSDQLEKSKEGKASKSQKNASDKMKEMSESMKAMQAQNSEESLEEDIKALREILENLIQMSFDQERLKKTLVNTPPKSPQYVAINAEQKRLSDDAKMIEDSLFALSKRIAEISSFVNKEISSIHMNMDKAIGHMAKRQTPYAATRQQMVMTSVNNLALMLSEISQQMQEQLASQMQQKPGNGSCSKPGSSKKPGKGKPSMATMKGLQKQLNEQMKQMKEGMGKPGSSGKPSSEKLAKMAAQQEMLRNALQGMMNEMIKEGESGSTGSMRNAINKMEQTETDIVNKNITYETLKRQEEIMTRLLEAENAQRERELDNKRESNENIFNQKRNISVFNEYNRLMKEEAELLRTLPPALKPFYRNMVKEYFNTIN
jgi:hypothetical protein